MSVPVISVAQMRQWEQAMTIVRRFAALSSERA